MAMISCPDCQKSISDAASACPNCGRPRSSTPPPAAVKNDQTARPVGVLLGIGIFLMPYIFAWYTLGKGRSITARVLSMLYLGAFVWVMISAGADGIREESAERVSMAASSVAATQSIASGSGAENSISVDEMLSEYKENEVSADNRYKDKMVSVVGVVDGVKKDMTGSPYVLLEGRGLRSFRAEFNVSDAQKLVELRKGQRIRVVCRVTGLMMNIMAEDCRMQ